MVARYWTILVICSLVAGAAAQPPATATAPVATGPATQPAQVPAGLIGQISQLYQQPKQQMPRAELLKLLTQRMDEIVKLGLSAEKDFPDATNLHEVRRMVLPAADFLTKQRGDQASRKHLLGISRRLLASDAPARSKVAPDYFLTLDKIGKLTGDQSRAKAAELVRQMADRYRKTPAAGAGLVYATMAADQGQLTTLKAKLLDELQAKHLLEPGVQTFLQRHGRDAYSGTTFKADLRRLDGKPLRLPDDLGGKVVLVDFWASWCMPCVVSMPELKELYAKHKGDGFEIVGISLDRTREDVQSFVKAHKLPWVHTYSGRPDDPTAAKYGVSAIPSMWLIGRDGKVITNQARGRLDTLIPEALKAAPPEK